MRSETFDNILLVAIGMDVAGMLLGLRVRSGDLMFLSVVSLSACVVALHLRGKQR